MEDGKEVSKEEVKAIIRAHTKLMEALMDDSVDRSLQALGLETIPPKIYPYLAALTVLALCGKDPDKEGLTKLLDSVDILTDSDITDKLATLKLKNRLVYMNAISFLVTIGKPINQENMVRTLRALDVYPDLKMINAALEFYKINITK